MLQSSFSRYFYTDFRLNNIISDFENKNNDIIKSIEKLCFIFDKFSSNSSFIHTEAPFILKMSNYDKFNLSLLNSINPFKINFKNPTKNILKILFPENKSDNLNKIEDIIDFGISVLHGGLPRFDTTHNKWITSYNFKSILCVDFLKDEYYDYLLDYYRYLNLVEGYIKISYNIHKTFRAPSLLYLTDNGTTTLENPIGQKQIRQEIIL